MPDLDLFAGRKIATGVRRSEAMEDRSSVRVLTATFEDRQGAKFRVRPFQKLPLCGDYNRHVVAFASPLSHHMHRNLRFAFLVARHFWAVCFQPIVAPWK